MNSILSFCLFSAHGVRQEHIDDSEDEFSLDKNQFTSEILSSVVPEGGFERRNENEREVNRHPSNEDEDYNGKNLHYRLITIVI